MLSEWLYIITLIVSFFASIILIVVIWPQRQQLASRWFMIALMGATVFAGASLFYSVSATETQAFTWIQVRLSVMAVIPVLLYGFVMTYTGHPRRVRPSYLLALLIVPAITVGMIWWQPELIWQSWAVTRTHLLYIESLTFNIWFYVHSAYSYGLVILACAQLINYALRSNRFSRRQIWTLALAIFIPMTLFMLPTLGLTRNLPNPASIGLAVMFIIFFWALFRQGLLTLSPLAYQTIIESMHDAVFVVDMADNLVLVNAAAQRLFVPQTALRIMGRAVHEVLGAQITRMLERAARHEAEFEAEIDVNNETRRFHIRMSPIRNAQGETEQRLFVLRDITERKRIENTLNDKYAELDRFFSVALDLLCIADTQGRFIKLNKAWEQTLGYPIAELERRAYLDFVHPDDVAATHQAMAQLDRQEQLLSFTNRYRTRDGSYRYIEWRSNPYGNVVYAAARDVTARKQMEDELREINRRYDELVASLPLMVYQLRVLPDGQFEYDYLSPRCEEFTGVSQEDALRDPGLIEANFTPEARQEHLRLTQAALVDFTPFEWEGPMMLRGETRWVQMISRPRQLANGDVVWDGIHMDITERKRMEDDLRHGEARLKALLAAMPDLMFRNHRDGRFLDYHAPEGAALFVPPEKFVGFATEDVLPAHLSERHIYHIRQALSTGQQQAYDYELADERGLRTYEARMVPADTDEVLTIVRDVTEIRESQQRALELILEKERRQLLTTFIQNAAHEFRTPLTAVRTGAYLMSRSDDAERRASKLAQIDAHIDQLLQLFDGLLLMARMESPSPLDYRPVDIRSILTMVCQDAAATYHRSPLRLDIAPDMPVIDADAIHLADAFGRIVANACRYTPDEGTITVAAGVADDYLWVTIQDTGPGITAEALPHIFETFWREDAAHSTPGLGLGLPIAQRIIERHQGSITVQSVEGEGSLFRVTLPLTSDWHSDNGGPHYAAE